MSFRQTSNEITERRDAMAELTNRIVAELEKGVKPWVREWDPYKCQGPHAPFNPVTGCIYHGVNVLILGMDTRTFTSGDPRWITYLQTKEKGWQVKKGEKATTIFFTKKYAVRDRDSETIESPDDINQIRIMRHYAVFHPSQIDGIPPYRPPPVEEAPWYPRPPVPF